MQIFIRKPSINFFSGIRVDKDTKLTYKNDNVEQTLENLEFHSVTKIKGETFESVYDTTIHLSEGDLLVFEEKGRGYIKPVEDLVTIEEAIEDLINIKDIGQEAKDVCD